MLRVNIDCEEEKLVSVQNRRIKYLQQESFSSNSEAEDLVQRIDTK